MLITNPLAIDKQTLAVTLAKLSGKTWRSPS